MDLDKHEETDDKGRDDDRLSFSLSDEEAEDTADSLDIKPPQAITHRKPRHKKEKFSYRDSKRSHNHKELSSHRKSHHQGSSDRRRQHKDEEKIRDKGTLHLREKEHREKRLSHRERRLQREKGEHEHSRDVRLSREHYYRNDSKSDERSSQDKISLRELAAVDSQMADQILYDLRGKLIDKRNIREGKSYNSEKYDEPERKKIKREREMEIVSESPLNETPKEKAERLEREERKAKLLEADREMAKRKEVSRRELEARRERHNIEKEKDRMLKEIAKKHKIDEMREKIESRTHDIVVVSDNSEAEESEESVASTPSSESEDEEDDDEDDNDNEDLEDGGDVDERTGNSDNEETDDEELMDERTPESVPPLEKSPIQSDIDVEDEKESDNEEESKKSAEKRNENNEKPASESPKSEETKEDSLPPYLPAIQGCRSVEEFQCLNRIEEGTYGVVYRARDKRTNDIVALKRLKMEKEKEGFPITSLREINTLLKAQHPNIVTVREIVVGSNMDKIFIVMDYVEHDLKSLMETMKQKNQVFVAGEVKCLMQQLLRAVAHLHDNWILHRDLKTSNLLLSHKGVLKVGDFGLAREYGSPLKIYTPVVVTLWYRAPELLLQSKEYTTAIDMWSVGCIFGELLQMEALFSGRTEMGQLNKIFKELGTPNEKIWPGYSKLPATQRVTFGEYPINQIRNRFGTILSELGIDLINKFLTYDPVQRITAEDALKHDYFKEAPLPIDPAMFPTWPAKSEQGHKKVNNSPKPPSGGKEYKQLGDTDEDVSAGRFHMGVMERRLSAIGPGGFWMRSEVFGKSDEDPEIECSQHYLSFCLSLLPRLVDQSVLKRMPTSEKEIESLCHGFDTEMECFNRYASKCLVPRERQLIDVYSSGAKNIYKHLCNDKSFRTEYLRHTRCFKGTQSDWESCVNRFVELLKDELDNQNMTKETRVLHTCCAIHGFSRCVFVPGTMKCERDDALFLLKLTEISIDRQKYYRDCRSITNYTICPGCTSQTSCILLITGYLILRISN